MSRSPPAGSYSNGHHHKLLGGGTAQRDHFRSRRSRQSGVTRVSSGQQETEAPPPCTDFDKAYFQSYSHVGIHEEMIKVLRELSRRFWNLVLFLIHTSVCIADFSCVCVIISFRSMIVSSSLQFHIPNFQFTHGDLHFWPNWLISLVTLLWTQSLCAYATLKVSVVRFVECSGKEPRSFAMDMVYYLESYHTRANNWFCFGYLK